MTTTINRFWWYQFVISIVLVSSVKSNCISKKDFKYSCGNISVQIDLTNKAYEIIEINCADHYKEVDYVKWIANLNHKPTKPVHIKISRCPIPKEPFAQIISPSYIQFFQYFEFKQATGLLNSTMPTFKKYHFENFSSVEIVYLTHNILKELEEDIFTDVVNLEKLYLNDNDLRSLPEKIFEPLKKLKTLNISGNNLTSLEEGIFSNLFALEGLYLSTNRLDNLTKMLFSSLNNLKKLELADNSMKILNNGIFDNLKNLETLLLNGNKLMLVPEKPFVHNTNLVTINLNEAFDKLNFTLSPEFFNNLQSLKKLHLQSNNLSALPKQIFQFSAAINLEILYLSHNRLSTLDYDLLHELRKLQELDLGYNQLSRLENDQFNGLENLKTLRINNNQLINIREKFCQVPGPYYLKELDLSNNQITMNTTTDVSPLQDCHSLTKLNLSNNSVTKIYNDWRQSFDNLLNLQLQKNKLKKLTVEDFHFPISTSPTINYSENEITSIDLTGMQNNNTGSNTIFKIDKNPILCDCYALSLTEYLQRHAPRIIIKADAVFCNAPESLNGTLVKNVNVKDLKCPLHEIHPEQKDNCQRGCICSYRSKDKVVEVNCTHKGMMDFPRKIPTTNYDVELSLDSNNLTSVDGIDKIPKDIRNRVVILSLTDNKLKRIDGIEQLKGLKTLKLDNNRLTILPIKDLNSLGNLTTITLDKNQWKCDCQHGKPLLGFIRKRQHNKTLNQGDIQCTDWPNHPMITSLTEDDLCNTSSHYLLYGIIVTFLLLFCFFTLVYCIYKKEIKVWMFAHKLFSWIVTEEDIDKDKRYDAFISFSHKDQEFVDKHLIPELEKNTDHNYKLCIHYRDFIPGEFIPSQIVKAVENSRRTIIVLTPNFLESVWGKMEFRVAHLKAIEDNCARVIVIMLRDVTNKIVDDELRAYIRMHTYVKTDDKMFWNKLKYALGRPTTRHRRTRHGSMVNIELLNRTE